MKNNLRYYTIASLMAALFLATALPFILFKTQAVNFSKIPETSQTSIIVFTILCLLNVIFIVGYRIIPFKNLTFKQILIPVIIINIIVVFVLPLTSNDLYTHFYRARILVKYGANPYFDTYDKYSFDYYYPILNNVWSKHTAIYGPFFWIVLGGISWLAKASFLSVYLIKLFYSVIFFVSGYVVYKLTKSKKALYLFLWNPYLIFFGALDGHSDIFMLALILLSIFFANKKNIILSWTVFILAFLIKIYVLPLFIFILYLNLNNSKNKKLASIIKKLFLLIILSFVIVVLTYLPFWRGLETLHRYREIFGGYESGKYFLGAFPVTNYALVADSFQLLFRIAFIVFYLFAMLKLTRKNVYNLMALSMLFFVMAFIRIWNPWYFVIPVGLLTINYSKNSKYIFILSALGALYSILL